MASFTADDLAGLVDFGKQSLLLSAASIAFNPLFWNIIARQEYHNKILSRRLGGSYGACYCLTAIIFSLGILRDWFFHEALSEQPGHPLLETQYSQIAGFALLAAGNVLVLSSMWALGITGTYLGDYCGILMEEMVSGFPFNVTSAPMYWGATMNFLGGALWMGKPAGVLLAGEVFLGYVIALRFEDPFTASIYAKRERERARARARAAGSGAGAGEGKKSQ